MSDVPLDARLDALSNARRRAVCRHFAGSETEVAGLDELVDVVADAQRRRSSDGPDGDRHAVETQLYHVDIPKLSEVDVVEFDPRSGTVRYLGDPFVEEVLAVIYDGEVAPT